MAVKEVGSVLPSPAKKVGSAPMVDLAMRAFVHCGYNAQQAAGLLDMSAADFSKAFSINWPDRNGVMKKWDGLPFEVRQQFAALIAVEYDVVEPDVEQRRALREFALVLKKAVGE